MSCARSACACLTSQERYAATMSPAAGALQTQAHSSAYACSTSGRTSCRRWAMCERTARALSTCRPSAAGARRLQDKKKGSRG